MQMIEQSLNGVRVGRPERFENLQVFPLLREESAADAAGNGYLSLDEALARGRAQVTEVSEAGHVPELCFENRGADAILLLDGEELVGARQNRILNVSILVGAKRKIVVPVSCVEQGRWAYRSRSFSSAGRNLYARARAEKTRQVSQSMRASGSRTSDQSAIWASISDKSASMRVASETSAMSDIYEQRGAKLGEYAVAFAPARGQVGAVFAIGGAVRGLELFDSSATFAKYLQKLVGSYALDAIEEDAMDSASRRRRRRVRNDEDEATLEQVRRFLEEIQGAGAQRFAGVDEGEDVRLESDTLAGGALVKDGAVIHLAVFKTAATAAPSERGGGDA